MALAIVLQLSHARIICILVLQRKITRFYQKIDQILINNDFIFQEPGLMLSCFKPAPDSFYLVNSRPKVSDCLTCFSFPPIN